MPRVKVESAARDPRLAAEASPPNDRSPRPLQVSTPATRLPGVSPSPNRRSARVDRTPAGRSPLEPILPLALAAARADPAPAHRSPPLFREAAERNARTCDPLAARVPPSPSRLLFLSSPIPPPVASPPFSRPPHRRPVLLFPFPAPRIALRRSRQPPLPCSRPPPLPFRSSPPSLARPALGSSSFVPSGRPDRLALFRFPRPKPPARKAPTAPKP